MLLGSALKRDGRFQLQTRSDGVVDMIVVDFDSPDRLRAFARFDEGSPRRRKSEGKADPATLLRRGHLPSPSIRAAMNRYQGVVALAGEGLEAAAHEYFHRSSRSRRWCGSRSANSWTARAQSWRAGGLIVQFLPRSRERRKRPTCIRAMRRKARCSTKSRKTKPGWKAVRTPPPSRITNSSIPRCRANGCSIASTTARRARIRRTVRARPLPLLDGSIRAMLQRFTSQERTDMIGDDGRIGVTCEFCSTRREFDPKEFG